ncbi:uncharacterized protein PV09_00781 [Verruconis gallopava]|uniref:DUF155 domain-containing protein n=1 Tax=Verruconis gallopava TaxID=253628 RepID=A0A0D1Z7B8_9PEZI|nr:uncharacterized protein PV09_00781 [Verruconis gallopava]KIW08857.1 hypothetical protein PV09_00781 [Verruconis gallopava]
MAAANTKKQRGPPASMKWPETQRPQPGQRQGTGLFTVDRVLQFHSDIPSAQSRSPAPRPGHMRTPSGRHPLDPKLSGLHVPTSVPTRTSKVTEKLVLLPEAEQVDEEKAAFEADETDGPPTDDELALRKVKTLGKSEAERLPKSERAERLARVTAYCTASAFKLKAAAEFLKSQHNARTKMYDDCLYVVYHLPLLPGHNGFRVRSSPALKSPGGKHIVDEEIERNELHEYGEGYFGETDEYNLRTHESGSPSPQRDYLNSPSPQDAIAGNKRRRSFSPPRLIAPDAMSFGEMYIFGYGVVVFWNFTERQEKDILADMTFSTSVPLATKPQPPDSFETEEFHFEYNPDVARPRIFNDMITLKSGDHMIKLTMSHAIAQSTKLSFFEERMQDTMQEAVDVPRRLALTGRLGMKREEVVKILGRLFGSRVDVNLSSNILDTPDFFWDSEPTLHPLYSAVREYLEIKPRIQVLNERCKVFLDLAEILSDSIADKKMTSITWIIIVLIVISIAVTCSEVFLRFGILSGEKHKDGGGNAKINNIVNTRSIAGPAMMGSWLIPSTPLLSIARTGMTAAWALWAAKRWG